MPILKACCILLLYILTFTSNYAQKSYRVKNIHIEGNEILTDESLFKQMNTLPAKKLDKLLFWKRRQLFTLSVFDDDIERLKSYYLRNGFASSKISYAIDSVKRKVNLHIKIVESDFIKINQLNYVISGDSIAQFIVDSIKPSLPIKENRRFKDDDIFKTKELLEKSFEKYGYPFANIDYKIQLNKEHTLSDVAYHIDSEKKYYFGNISILGDTLTPRKFIHKYIAFSSNQTYNQPNIDKTQQRLFDTELFHYVIIKSIKDSIQDNKIPVEIWLKELPHWQFEGGVGFGTEDRLRLSAQLTRLSFFGGTRRLIFKAKTSHFVPLHLELKFIQPDLWLENLDMIVKPFFLREREPSFMIDRFGGSLNFIYEFNKRLSINLGYAVERDQIQELNELQLNEDELNHEKSIISIGSDYNTTNSKFYPTKGYKLSGSLSYAGLGFGEDIHYYQTVLSWYKYHELSKAISLAFRLKSGIMQATENSSQTPIEERFFAGGASSLRGWSRHSISPVNADGFATGGNTILETSAEVRFPIYDIFGGVVFTDIGNVWLETFEYDFYNLRYNAGVGIRVKSPIGPIRLDMASPVIKDSFNFQFFISIGQTF